MIRGMAKRIFKYVIPPDALAGDGHVDLELPEGAWFLHAAGQLPRGAGMMAHLLAAGAVAEQLCVWALVDPDAPLARRRLYVHGTGHEVAVDSAEASHVGTAVMEGGALVLHVFDAGEVRRG